MLKARFITDVLYRKYKARYAAVTDNQSTVQKWLESSPCEGATVFAGDSITAAAPITELLGTALNRGIPGEKTIDLLERLNEITRHKPERLFLMIGTNDVQHLRPASETLSTYRNILQDIHDNSPHTKTFLSSVPPFGCARHRYRELNALAVELNNGLKELAGDTSAHYIDLWPVLQNDGVLRDQFTDDGVHFNKAAYEAWAKVMRQYV